MRKLLASLGALVVAALSFALTLGLLLGLRWAVDLDLFSFMWWGVIPIGAFVTGLLAASGYYFGAVKLDVKPTRSIALGILVVAALVQVALYYSQFAAARTEEGQAISGLVGFPRFVGWMLTHAKYGVVVHGYRPGGGLEVGWFGYVLAVVQFLALVAGGFLVYFMLADKPYCDACSKYSKPSASHVLHFAGDMRTVDELRRTEVLSAAYFEALRGLPPGNTAALELELSRCPSCGKEALAERPLLLADGKLSYQGDAYRTSWTQPGLSVAAQLSSLAAPPADRRAL